MADLPHTICFRAGEALRDWLRSLAAQEHRKLGDTIRLLLEEMKRIRDSHG